MQKNLSRILIFISKLNFNEVKNIKYRHDLNPEAFHKYLFIDFKWFFIAVFQNTRIIQVSCLHYILGYAIRLLQLLGETC